MKKLGILSITLVIAGLSIWKLYPVPTPAKKFARSPKTWQTVPVQVAKDFSSIKLPAKVKSNQLAIISPRRSGIIQDLLVDIGDKVTKGQTIGSMLPEGVEGQSSAAINEARARLQKARAALTKSKSVAIKSVSVATKEWREKNLQSLTQSALEQETQKQLTEKKSEAVLVATQAWENTKLALFGSGSNTGARVLHGNFSDSVQENTVSNLADKIQRMEQSEPWNNLDTIIEHLIHLENFLAQAESLYKNAREGRGITVNQISTNLRTIQNQQLKVSQTKQSILALQEKKQRFSSIGAEKTAGIDKSREVLDLVQSQQDLTITAAEKNIAVALANYDAALVRSGHQSITSPFSGIITARMAEVGQSVAMNNPLFYLEGAQTARSQESLAEIHFRLPESWKNKISLGDTVVLKTMNGESFEGKIFRLSAHINLSSNSIMATAIISSPLESGELDAVSLPQISHGQSLFVYLTSNENYIVTVPTTSLKKRSNNYFLWKMNPELQQDDIEAKNFQPLQIQVEVIAEDGEFSQVFSKELKIDDAVISNPSVSLFKK